MQLFLAVGSIKSHRFNIFISRRSVVNRRGRHQSRCSTINKWWGFGLWVQASRRETSSGGLQEWATCAIQFRAAAVELGMFEISRCCEDDEGDGLARFHVRGGDAGGVINLRCLFHYLEFLRDKLTAWAEVEVFCQHQVMWWWVVWHCCSSSSTKWKQKSLKIPAICF